MITFAYPKMYLETASNNLGDMIDCAVNHYGFDVDVFFKMFVDSGFAKRFSLGDPTVLLGKSGKELCRDVFFRLYGKEIHEAGPLEGRICKTAEFWAGWILAQYQWYSCQSFETIFNCIPMSDLVARYYPLHEAVEDKTFEVLDNILVANGVQLFNGFDGNHKMVSLKKYSNPVDCLQPSDDLQERRAPSLEDGKGL